MALLKDKVAIVTGGGRGLGKAFSKAIAREGAHIAILGRDQTNLDQTKQEIENETGRTVLVFAGDVSDANDVSSFGSKVRKTFDRVDILINNAAGWLTGTFIDAKQTEIISAIDTTIKGPIWLCREFWGELCNARPGYIINITSLGARPSRSNASPIYVAAKFGLAGFTDALRRLAIKDGILVTEILPGSVASEFDLDTDATVIENAYHGKRITPKDVIDTVVFALSRSPSAMVEEIRIPAVGDWLQDFARY